ncbi:MAG: nitrogen regulation protein NR(I) [Citromicrobium sp.]|nr:MAG: nitrogen regulation protein NR(I) [Citromicrobium sp.]
MTWAVLLVEDDKSIAAVITEALTEEGFEVTCCASVVQRDSLLRARQFDVMVTDVKLEDGDGLAAIERVRDLAPDMPFIVLSAQNTLDTAVRASDSRAFEYFPKPFDLEDLVHAVRQAVSSGSKGSATVDEVEQNRLPLIGRSRAMQDVYRMITRVLGNNLTVLVTGESGTGKELVAEAVHQLGARKSGPFVAMNMAAIPHELLESELFGHERGAFTGAIAQQIGKFEQANGGTLFLDEIGDMPAEAQTRLLRTLQSGRIRRVGGRHEIGVDVRIIAATNRDLLSMIADGRFREDLYYRLNVVPIAVPPLRERRDDIDLLARHFLNQAEIEGLPAKRFSADAMAQLEDRSWKGNVRELRNAVFRLALMAREEEIDSQAVSDVLGPENSAEDQHVGPSLPAAIEEWFEQAKPASGEVYTDAIAAFERPLFEHVLRDTNGNQLRAAERLGINRNTLRKRLSDLEIDPAAFTRRPDNAARRF